jgi:M6 family metalloprotease-like protein
MKKIIIALSLLLSFVTFPAKAESNACRIPSLHSGAQVGFPIAPGKFKNSGEIKIKVLFISFLNSPNRSKKETKQLLEDLQLDYVAKSYSYMSYGKVKIKFEPYMTWLRLPNDSNSYELGINQESNLSWQAREQRYLNEVIGLADPGIDFSKTDGLAIISDPDDLGVYGGAFGVRASADGRDLSSSVFLGNLINHLNDPHLVLRHELGHAFGWADLYTRSGFGSVGDLSFMANTWSEYSLLGWERYQKDWITNSQILCGTGDIKLTDIEKKGGMKMAILPISQFKVLIIEKHKHKEFSGIISYIVDSSIHSGSEPILVLSTKTNSFFYEGYKINISKDKLSISRG